jgi:hypothetical protein
MVVLPQGIIDMIPKRIFLYWCAPKLSYLRYLCLCSLKKHHPDWDITLYNVICSSDKKTWSGGIEQDFEADVGDDYLGYVTDLGIHVVDINCSSAHPIHTGDMFRYSELHHNGGIYVDTDLFWVASMDDLYEKFSSHGSVITHHADYGFQIGFLAAQPGSQLFSDWLVIANTRLDNGAHYQSCGVDALISLLCANDIESPIPSNIALAPDLVKSLIYNYPDTHILDGKLLYEVDGSQADRLFEGDLKLEPRYCIHLYGGSPVFQKYNKLVNADNIGDFNGPCFQWIKGDVNAR